MPSSLSALSNRLGLSSDELDRFRGALVRAIETYRWAKQCEARHAPKGAPAIAHQLDRFHRSLGRTTTMRTAAKHWAELSRDGQTFIEMRLKMADPPRASFANLDLDDAADLAVLRDAVGAARRWLGEKPGRAHGPAIRELVAEVGRAYRRATGKRPGLSSAQTVAGPDYATPFEEVLVAVLKEAGMPLSLEAARSLYRSELRGKPKKLQP